jgi:hypothetical protein
VSPGVPAALGDNRSRQSPCARAAALLRCHLGEDTMRRHWVPIIILSVIVFGASTMDSTAYLSEEAPLCKNWEQGCAQLWGSGTRHYRQCMRQPQAIRDCQVDNFAGSDDLCSNWLRECTRLYGSRSRAYRACMRQPQALADCGR